MEWTADDDRFDPASGARAVLVAVAIAIVLGVFLVGVLAGALRWASAVAGL